MFASVFLVLILLLVAPLAAYLPNAAMAGILFLVAWGLIDFHHIASIGKTSKAETVVLWVTLRRHAGQPGKGHLLRHPALADRCTSTASRAPRIVPVVPAKEEGAYHFVDAHGHHECPQFRIVRINGSIFFGAVDHVQNGLTADRRSQSASRKSVTDRRQRHQLHRRRRRRNARPGSAPPAKMGGGLYFYRLEGTAYQFLRQGDYVHDIGEGAFFPVMTNVIGALYWTLDPNVCRSCKSRIFKECHGSCCPTASAASA